MLLIISKLSTDGGVLSIMNEILSFPLYSFPTRSLPLTLAKTSPSLVLETFQVKIHCVGESVAVIGTFVAIPVMEKVGVAIKASEKFAVMVTTSEFLTILLGSLSVSATVGAVLSILKVILSFPV